jgi:hypothetical protein
MTDVYFHCSESGRVLGTTRGVAIDDLVEAIAHADRIVRAYVMTPSAEDWRNWVLHATDELGGELFTVPFASVVGKLH